MRKIVRLQGDALRFALFGHCSLRGGLLWYTTKVAMESPIIVCSHQNDRSVDSTDDASRRAERLFVPALVESVVVLLPGAGCSDGGR